MFYLPINNIIRCIFFFFFKNINNRKNINHYLSSCVFFFWLIILFLFLLSAAIAGVIRVQSIQFQGEEEGKRKAREEGKKERGQGGFELALPLEESRRVTSFMLWVPGDHLRRSSAFASLRSVLFSPASFLCFLVPVLALQAPFPPYDFSLRSLLAEVASLIADRGINLPYFPSVQFLQSWDLYPTSRAGIFFVPLVMFSS